MKAAERHTTWVPRISLPTWSPERFREARQARGWTLGQLAATADLTYGAVTAYAGGVSSPSPQVLVRLAEVLEVATTDLAPLSQQPSLHEYRWHAGLTVADLAERVGLTRDYVSRILRGEIRISDPTAWSEALGLPPGTVQQAWDTSHALLNRRS